MEVKLRLEGQRQLLNSLSLLIKATKDTRSLMAKLAVLGFKDIMAHFKTESGPDGRWAPLSPRTLLGRRKKGKGAKILQDTGRLRASIQPLVESPRRAVLASTNVIYARTHQFGRGRIPARPFMWLSRQTKNNMLDLARAQLRRRA